MPKPKNLIVKKGSRVSKPGCCAGEKQDFISEQPHPPYLSGQVCLSVFHRSQPLLCSVTAAKLFSKVINNTQASHVAGPKRIKAITTSVISLLLQHDVTFQYVDCPHHCECPTSSEDPKWSRSCSSCSAKGRRSVTSFYGMQVRSASSSQILKAQGGCNGCFAMTSCVTRAT